MPTFVQTCVTCTYLQIQSTLRCGTRPCTNLSVSLACLALLAGEQGLRSLAFRGAQEEVLYPTGGLGLPCSALYVCIYFLVHTHIHTYINIHIHTHIHAPMTYMYTSRATPLFAAKTEGTAPKFTNPSAHPVAFRLWDSQEPLDGLVLFGSCLAPLPPRPSSRRCSETCSCRR